MSDKMMRIAGRGDDGTAKGVGVTDEGVLKTHTTGSLVLISRHTNYEISGGGAGSPFGNRDLEDFTRYMVTIRANTNHNFHIEERYVAKESVVGSGTSNPNIISDVENGDRDTTPFITRRGELLWLRFLNNSTSAKTYDIHLFGVK